MVTFTLNKRSFAFYNGGLKIGMPETGDFEIMIGKSSKEIILRSTITVQSTLEVIPMYHSIQPWVN